MLSHGLILDAFCGAGGAGAGYARAGFLVVGVDIEPQPRYPYPFVRADAIDYIRRYGHMFDAVHASPPCKTYSALAHFADPRHVGLVEATRDAILSTGKPYVIENVPGAPLRDPLVLCGTEFDLSAVDSEGRRRWLRRHRLFESSVPLTRKGECDRCSGHERPIGGVYGTGTGAPVERIGKDGRRRGGYKFRADAAREVLGVPWMTLREASQAIPPAYTEHIGRQLAARLAGVNRATVDA